MPGSRRDVCSCAPLAHAHSRTPQNNVQRKRLYQDCAIKLSYTFRRPLPDCLVGMVRGIWPSATGLYMGYKPGSGWGGVGQASSSDDDGDSDSDGGGAGGGGLTGAVGSVHPNPAMPP